MPFTPGPWTIEVFPASDCEDGNACTAITALANEDGKEGFILAEVNRWAYGDDPATEESYANAQLIAAAPALLAACKEALAAAEQLLAEADKKTNAGSATAACAVMFRARVRPAIALAENSANNQRGENGQHSRV